MPVWEPHNQGVAGLTDPDDPILLHQELDRQAAIEAQEAERESELLRREEQSRRTEQLDAGQAVAGNGSEPRAARASKRHIDPVIARRELSLGNGTTEIDEIESDVLASGQERSSPALFLLLTLVLVGALAFWVFGPNTLHTSTKPSPELTQSATGPGALPVAPANEPMSNPVDVGALGDRVPAELLPPDLLLDDDALELPAATDSLQEASSIVASIPVPEAEVAAASDSVIVELAATPEMPVETQNPALDEELDAVLDTVAALTERVHRLEQPHSTDESFRLVALEQRINVLQEQTSALIVRTERAEMRSAAAQKAAQRKPAPAQPADKAQPPAKQQRVVEKVEQQRDPGVQLLAIDSWAGEPSIIVGSTAFGGMRTRTLAVGDTINGITLRAVDTRAAAALFDLGKGQTLQLKLNRPGGLS